MAGFIFLPPQNSTNALESALACGGIAPEGPFMESNAFKSMSTDKLWSLHEQMTSILARKIAEEKTKLEERLCRLENANSAIGPNRPRRAYPKVLPKYQNPKNNAETWSGRGKQPHWVRAQLGAGKKLEHFLIARPSIERRHNLKMARTSA
jgi:DNA-binding protein H-NS